MVDLNKDIARINEFVKSIEEDGFGENDEKVLVLRNGIVLRAWIENNLTSFQMYDHNASEDAVTENEDINYILKKQFIGWYHKYIMQMVRIKQNILLPGMTISYISSENAYLVPSDVEHAFICKKVPADAHLIEKTFEGLEMDGKLKFWTME